MRVLGMVGSLRTGSYNRRLLLEAARWLPDRVNWKVWDELGQVPPFNEDIETAPGEPVRALRAAIAEADAVLIATPEYNGSVPGQLKNVVDWASRPAGEGVLRGKPSAVVGASPSAYGASWAQAELRRVLGNAGARVLDRELAVARAHEAFDAAGRLADPEQVRQLRSVVDDLAGQAGHGLTGVSERDRSAVSAGSTERPACR